MQKSVIPILDQLDLLGVDEVTFTANQFEEEYFLGPDDKDWVTFHKNVIPSFIVDKLQVCDYSTSKVTVHKDWYMTINYHA